jgi:hypothetical protein
MNKLLPAFVLLAGIASCQAASIDSESSLAARRAECFAMHGQLMEKPALRNERACWQAHAYLMDRR